ncbi:MAG: hypothetical protein KDI09_01020, partial [Halioglobus sp.]|nr:hypothetical protein [Halioglobus sp.]
EKAAAEDRAVAFETEARAEAESVRAKYEAEAQGTRQLNEAKNILNSDQISLAVRLALIETLPQIIRESVKPAEQIESIKILDVRGMQGIGATESGGASGSSGLADDLVGAMLKYQMMHPLAKNLIEELGLESGATGGSEAVLKNLLLRGTDAGDPESAGVDFTASALKQSASTSAQSRDDASDAPTN